MAWSNDSPDGTKATKTNVPIMLANTQYTKTSLNLDHNWDVGTNEDGSHKFIQAEKVETAGVPSDPTLRTGMDSVLYSKAKTAAEAVAQQDVQYFMRNAGLVMQMLSIRAMALFDINTSTKAITVQYAHNVASVVRTAESLYTVTFTTALPSVNYLVLGNGMGGSADSAAPMAFSVQSAAALATSKTTALCKIRLASSDAGSPATADPLQAWVIMFGG